MSGKEDTLNQFIPPVREWFREALGAPTPPQALGWPPIMRGENTLILAPTGSGKTLAAFLWGINRIFAELQAGSLHPGIDVVYVSPLKALNNDIERNLRVPIEGAMARAEAAGTKLAQVRVAVRTGDTPSSARVAMTKRPPHVLITTPESLYIVLTSAQAREVFRNVRTVIVDEIHTMVGNKRGVHLALSLERLEHLIGRGVQRIGLSATVRPVEEAARFLGGQTFDESGVESQRPVTTVDAGYRKPLDLQVIGLPLETLKAIKEGGGVWANLIPRVLDLVREHRATLIFCNNRRLAERTADRLNEQFFAEETGEVKPGSSAALAPEGVPRGTGMMGITSRGGPFRAHHASITKEARLRMEQELKSGQLPALVGTGSLELGIDMGSIDLVVQIESPKGVTQGLQRVGRSGHLVGQTSVGRVFPTHAQDLLEAAAVARGMARGEVEDVRAPHNCLDVLAQQIVAAVSVDDWSARALYGLSRQSYPYRDLPWEAFRRVLEMLSGKYPSEVSRALRPRIVWDRVNDRLTALPGTRMLAVTNGGTISDRGAFPVYLADGKTRIGELDEEFVFETKTGDAFVLGSQVWRAVEITDDRVVVASAAGSLPRMPFWRGEMFARSWELSLQVGRLRRELAERLRDSEAEQGEAPPDVVQWLMKEYLLDEHAARAAVGHVRRQLDATGEVASDHTIVVEAFPDAVGDMRIVVHAPFGGRINAPLALALSRGLRDRLGVEPETQVDDDGILFRLPAFDGPDAPGLDMLEQLSPSEARERVLAELPGSAVFGARFRQDAARALLLPGLGPRRRTPFWLQRLRAKDLLAAVKRFPDFPVLVETYRDCITEAMDLPHLQEVLERIGRGEIRVVHVEGDGPSPEASGLLSDFINTYMYEWDAPKSARATGASAPDRELLASLLVDPSLANMVRPEAAKATLARVQHADEHFKARTPEELSLLLEQMGDLTAEEVAARCDGDGAAWLAELERQGRAARVRIGHDERWVAAELLAEYTTALGTEVGSSPRGPLPYLPPRGEGTGVSGISLPLGERPREGASAAGRASERAGGPGQGPLSPARGGGLPPQGAEAPLLPPLGESRKGGRADVLRRFLSWSGPVTMAEIRARYPLPRASLDEALAALVEAREVVRARVTPDAPGEQWCDRRLLEQMRRQSIGILRREVQAVPFHRYVDFLLRWQHAHATDRLKGRSGLEAALRQLQGCPVSGQVWERDALPARVDGFEARALDEMCAAEELFWAGDGGQDPSLARFRLLLRGEGAALLPDADDESPPALTPDAARAFEFIRSQGTASTRDLRDALGLDARALQRALTELAVAGVADALSWRALADALSTSPHQPPERMTSSLEAQLAVRHIRSRGLTHSQRAEIRRRTTRHVVGTPAPTGVWRPVRRFAVIGRALSQEERAERRARQLLARYGVVSRLCLEWEAPGWAWEPIAQQLQLMEFRGQARRGYFVSGLPGLQYALPDAMARLRGSEAEGPEVAITVINACDPAFVRPLADSPDAAGLALSRVPANYLCVSRGRVALVAEGGGARLGAAPDTPEETLRAALAALTRTLTVAGGVAAAPRRLAVTHWNGEPVLRGPGAALLASAGFRRDMLSMAWYG